MYRWTHFSYQQKSLFSLPNKRKFLALNYPVKFRTSECHTCFSILWYLNLVLKNYIWQKNLNHTVYVAFKIMTEKKLNDPSGQAQCRLTAFVIFSWFIPHKKTVRVYLSSVSAISSKTDIPWKIIKFKRKNWGLIQNLTRGNYHSGKGD